MARKSSRRRAKRRDRRRARMSGWKREGKPKMSGKVGHGTNGGAGRPSKAKAEKGTPELPLYGVPYLRADVLPERTFLSPKFNRPFHMLLGNP